MGNWDVELDQNKDRVKTELGMSEEISREEIAALLARGSEEMPREQARDTLRNAAWLGTNEDRERIERAVELLCGEPCGDTISRHDSIAALKKHFSDGNGIDTECGAYWHHSHVIEVLQGMPPVTPKQEPCEDAVSRGVFEQVMWERDVAIDQLKELGYGFGEKPKTGHWIYDRTRDWDGECKYECSECGMGSDVDYPYCMRCGAKMEE